MTTVTSQKLRFFSRPYRRRIGLIPMTIAMVLAWTLVAVYFVFATSVLQQFALWGSLMLFTLLALGAWLIYISYCWVKDSQQQHELSIDGALVTLATYDAQTKKQAVRQISLDEVISAEYYEPKDTASLLLRSHRQSLDIPLWSFGPDVEKRVVEYVALRGIEIIGIPNDVVI